MAGSVFDAGAQKAIRTLSLDVVVKRGVEHRRLRRRVGRDRQSSRSADVAGPLDPEAPRPFRRIVQPVARHVAGGAADGDRDVLIVGGIKPGHDGPRLRCRARSVTCSPLRRRESSRLRHFGCRRSRADGRLHLQVRVIHDEGRHVEPGTAAHERAFPSAFIAPRPLRRVAAARRR